jgi:predicted methyltransferase
MKYFITAALAGVLAAGCTTAPAAVEPATIAAVEAPAAETPAPEAAAPAEAMPAAFDYASVFGQDDRPAGDYELYGIRKSEQVLAFTGVAPGMSVIDMEAGDGYYTELFSRVVGDAGKVYLQNPAQFDGFLGDSVPKRVDGRLANVTVVKSAFDDLSALGDGSADLVTWMLGPHELWYTPDGGQPGDLGNPEAAFAEIARITKTGGHFVVLDHMAPAGSPATTGGDTHRIDKAIVVSMAEAAGFTLVDESDILANAEDDGTVNVFDPSMRRKTDRFLLKFEKQAASE